MPAAMVTNLTRKVATAVRLTTVIMATVLIAPDLTVKTGTARSVLITVTALIARALILVRTMVTVRSVLVTITIMATVPIVRAITAKAATVRNALMETIRVTVLTVRAITAKVATVRNALIIVTVLIVHASIRVVEDLADTATETAIAVQSVVRPIMTPMLSTARRNR